MTVCAQGLGGVAVDSDAAPKTSEPSLDWRPLWRGGSAVLDFLEAVGRQKLETYFGQGIPAGISPEQCVLIGCD